MFCQKLFSLEAFAVGVAEVDPFGLALLLVDALVEGNMTLLEKELDKGFELFDLAVSRDYIRCPTSSEVAYDKNLTSSELGVAALPPLPTN